MRTLIGVPCMDMVHTQFMSSLLGLEPLGDVELRVMRSSLIYDARNLICRDAVEGGYDRILWLDSDIVFDGDLLVRLSKHLDDGKEIVTGLCFTRREPIKPVIYSDVRMVDVEGKQKPHMTTYFDYPSDSLFTVDACGMAAVLMNTDVVKRIGETYGLPFSPILGFGEDISFCIRARKLGIDVWCDSSIKLGHIGNFVITEQHYRKGHKHG